LAGEFYDLGKHGVAGYHWIFALTTSGRGITLDELAEMESIKSFVYIKEALGTWLKKYTGEHLSMHYF
jgi:hypothetical protein